MRQCQNPLSTNKEAPSYLMLATYLLGASQGEEQVQCCLGEMQVLLHAKAHLQGGKESWQDGQPAGHLQPGVTLLIYLTQLLGQVQAQDTHLLGPRGKDEWKRRSSAGEDEEEEERTASRHLTIHFLSWTGTQFGISPNPALLPHQPLRDWQSHPH